MINLEHNKDNLGLSQSCDSIRDKTCIVYHLPQINGTSCWDVNGKRFFWFTQMENSRDKRKFWKGSPIFPNGTFRMEIHLPFTSFLYGSREGTIQKYFANPKKYFKSQYFSQITVEKFDKSKKLLQILRRFVDPQITFSIIRKYFVPPRLPYSWASYYR